MILSTSLFALTAAFVGSDTAQIIDARAVALDGSVRTLGTTGSLKPVALVFVDTQCPIANKFVPRLGQLASKADELGVEFYGVLSDPTLKPGDALKWVDEYEISYPILFDATGDLATRLQPTHVPEAFVIDTKDTVRYRGRIDDRFEAIGKLRRNIRSHDLLDAMESVVRGQEVKSPQTPPIGCLFEAFEEGAMPSELTYSRDIAPFLRANCIECHRAGDVGPFPLDTYESASRRAKMIALVTEERTMPPWFAEHGYGSFRDERHLTDRQIAMLSEWAEAGAPKGDEDDLLPTKPTSDSRWRLGEPDLVVAMPVAYPVPADGEDVYRYFVVPSDLVEDRVIVGVDFRPGDPSVVHHCIAYHDKTGWARRRDAKDDEPGFSVFNSSGEAVGLDGNVTFSMRQITGWAPGTQPHRYPDGTGLLLEAGGDFLLEVHYHPNGKKTTDRSALALYFAKEPVPGLVENLVIGTERINIAPGNENYRRHVWMELPMDVVVLDAFPHMHYLGKRVEATATLPTGEEVPLIRIDDWDFRWQGTYVYRDPLTLPEGTRIDARFAFDNSADNPFNPSSPPIRVREGWQTTDEMCLFYFNVVPSRPSELEDLYSAMFDSFGRSARDRSSE